MREILAPLEVIDELFAPYSDCDPARRPPSEWREKAHFIRILKLEDEDNFKHIPCLNDAERVEKLANSLVRYRCMVQDVLEPEVYPSVLIPRDNSKMVTMKYREVQSTDLRPRHLAMRGVYQCVALPGESAWAKARPATPVTLQGKRKAHVMEGDDSEDSGAAIVKLYDADEESLKVCETVEVLGVLCICGGPGMRLHGLYVA